ncbi:hypothetical protein CO608_07815 [Lysobacteraceae bacterium NML08-0793]|nr:hypothetical protein CO608_07815 [Xanthomonadaceae bacterium NML08-0793]
MAIVLSLPGTLLAQTAKERELEARIAELEKIVAALAAERNAQKAEIAEVRNELRAELTATLGMEAAREAADRAATATATPATGLMPGANPGTRFSYGGFIKLDAMTTQTDSGRIAEGSAGRMFHVPSTIPVGGSDKQTYTDFGAQFSRFWLGADHVSDAGDKLKAYIEVDFFGGGSSQLGNETATNTHALTLRHAYVSWNNWLAGQTWSNFMDVAALPDAVDFVGVTDGTVFVRQPQIRYTRDAWSFALENPQTWVQPHLAGARYNSGENRLPDFTARWQTRGDWGHVSLAAMLRQYRALGDSAQGISASLSGKFVLGAQDDLRYAINSGQGIGRYLSLGLGPDVMVDATGEIRPLTGTGGFIAWRHAFNQKLRGNLMYSAAHFDNDTDLTGLGITRSSQSLHANLIWSPLPKLDVGAELGWSERTLENGSSGKQKRIHTSVKYSF